MQPGQKFAVISAIAATVVGALLIGGPSTFASLNSSAMGQQLAITSGTLAASVAAPTTGVSPIAAATNGVVARPGSVGMIPGVQAQTLSYVVTNGGSARVPATVGIRVVSSLVVDAAAWAALRPYLAVTVSVNGGAAVAVPAASITAAGIDATLTPSGIVQPAATATVVLTFSIPATSGATDLARLLQSHRSSSASLFSVIRLQPVFTLSQVPRAS